MKLQDKTIEELFEMMRKELENGIERYTSGRRDIMVNHQGEVMKKPKFRKIEREIKRKLNEPKK